MAGKRRPPSNTVLGLFFGLVLAGSFAFSALVRIAPCPACAEWKPLDGMRVQTIRCEFCNRHDRVTLFEWYIAREWVDSQTDERY
jgi:hypothetical protein